MTNFTPRDVAPALLHDEFAFLAIDEALANAALEASETVFEKLAGNREWTLTRAGEPVPNLGLVSEYSFHFANDLKRQLFFTQLRDTAILSSLKALAAYYEHLNQKVVAIAKNFDEVGLTTNLAWKVRNSAKSTAAGQVTTLRCLQTSTTTAFAEPHIDPCCFSLHYLGEGTKLVLPYGSQGIPPTPGAVVLLPGEELAGFTKNKIRPAPYRLHAARGKVVTALSQLIQTREWGQPPRHIPWDQFPHNQGRGQR